MQLVPVVRHSPVLAPSAVREGQKGGDFAALLSQQIAVGGTSSPQGSVAMAAGADAPNAHQTAGRSSFGATALTGQDGWQPRVSKASNISDSTTPSSTQAPEARGQASAGKTVSASVATSQGILGSSVQSASISAGHDSSASLLPAMVGGTGASSALQGSESWMALLSGTEKTPTTPELPLVQATTTAPSKKSSAPTLSGGYASAGLWAMAAQMNSVGPVDSNNRQTAESVPLSSANRGTAAAIMASLTPGLSPTANGQTPVMVQSQSPPLFPDLAAPSLPPGTLGAPITATAVSIPALALEGSGHQAPPEPVQGINPLSPSLLPSQPSAVAPWALATPVSSTAVWGGELAQTVTWMIGRHQSTATLQLNPPDLGPMTVVVQVVGNQANAFFSSHHAQVRDAIQQALPQLSEQMASRGLMLGQANVSDQQAGSSQGGWAAMAENRQSLSLKAGSEVSSELSAVQSARVVTRLGLIDTFA